jgi:membrane-associated phospholipid phosphatase
MPRRLWALIVSVVTLLVFAGIAWQVHGGKNSLLAQLDREIAEGMREDAEEHPDLLVFFRTVTYAGGVPAMTVLAIVGVGVLLVFQQRRLALLWVVAAALGAGINFCAKTALDRPRPEAPLRDEAVTERNASYPSGHAMGSVIGYGSLAYMIVVLGRRRWAKVLAVAGLTLLVLLIGLSRIVLRAHWYSDVLGGYAIGLCWLSVCILVLGQREPTRPLAT